MSETEKSANFSTIGIITRSCSILNQMYVGNVHAAISAAYLTDFHTFAHSIRKAILADSHDIVVNSNDPLVFEDAVVRNLAHRRVLLSDSEIDSRKRIDASKVDPSLRHESFGKYTFLKFLTFKDQRYYHNIFRDVDMIRLYHDFYFKDLILSDDFSAAPTMVSRFLQLGDGKSGKGATEAVWLRIWQMFRRRSGVANASCLKQQIIQRFIATRPGLGFRSLPVSYNFAHAALAIGKAEFDALWPKPGFPHFNSKVNRLWRAAHVAAEGWIPASRPEAATEADAHAHGLA